MYRSLQISAHSRNAHHPTRSDSPAGFQYAMVLHAFETDPDQNPSPHPQSHLTVKAAGLTGMRLDPRKADIQRWREGFAEALREHGIIATTTSRIHRTRANGGRSNISVIARRRRRCLIARNDRLTGRDSSKRCCGISTMRRRGCMWRKCSVSSKGLKMRCADLGGGCHVALDRATCPPLS